MVSVEMAEQVEVVDWHMDCSCVRLETTTALSVVIWFHMKEN